MLDLLIIGGGPIGISVGLEAQNNGLSYLILEKGCIVNSLYHYPEGMTFFSTSDKLEIGGIPFISKNAKPFKSEALEYYRRIASSNNLNMGLFEKVLQINKKEGFFEVVSSKKHYQTRNLVIAIGFYDIPNLLNIKGEDLPKVSHYYKNAHFYARQKVAVVGANNSAVDAALEIYRKGGKVTMVVREAEIGKRVKYWVKPDIENRIKEGNIKAYFKSEIKEITTDSIIVQTPQGEKILPNDYVLALTGYRPNFKLLKSLGVSLSEDDLLKPVYKPETMESDVPGIYLAGVVCGGMETHKWFIENSRIHAPIIVSHILKIQAATQNTV